MNGKNTTMKHTKRYKELTHQEKCEIYNYYESGYYFQNEIQAKFNITRNTMLRVIHEIRYFLRTGTPKNL